MKTIPKTLIASLLLAGLAPGALATNASLDGLRVEHQVLPVFPDELMRTGVREGEVRLALSVDSLGNLEDLLVLMHTHREFADVTVGALKKWRFEPLRHNGVPVASTALITVQFETRGAVVSSLSAQEVTTLFMSRILPGRYQYRLHSLRELDQIPTPISVQAPGRAKGVFGEVAVGFYIDETGAVRIPSVDADADPILASLAIEALRQWRFEPPRCKGVPVLVKASQLFKFRPDENETVASRGGTR